MDVDEVQDAEEVEAQDDEPTSETAEALECVKSHRGLVNELIRLHGAPTFGPFLNELFVIEQALKGAQELEKAADVALSALEDRDTAWTPTGVEARQALRFALGKEIAPVCRSAAWTWAATLSGARKSRSHHNRLTPGLGQRRALFVSDEKLRSL